MYCGHVVYLPTSNCVVLIVITISNVTNVPIPMCEQSIIRSRIKLSTTAKHVPFHYTFLPNLPLSFWLQPLRSRGMCLCPTKSMPFSLLCTYQDIKNELGLGT